jgi:hypothetical protein
MLLLRVAVFLPVSSPVLGPGLFECFQPRCLLLGRVGRRSVTVLAKVAYSAMDCDKPWVVKDYGSRGLVTPEQDS